MSPFPNGDGIRDKNCYDVLCQKNSYKLIIDLYKFIRLNFQLSAT